MKIKAFTAGDDDPLRFLVRVVPPEAELEGTVARVKIIGKVLGVDPRNPKWTSYGALEMDLFASSRGDVELLLAALSPLLKVEFLRDLNVSPPHMTEQEALSEARDLFNAERYWECHEVLEGVWRTKEGPEKRLLQGIILVCAAFVHHQKREDQVAMGVLRRALDALEWEQQRYGPFDVSLLKSKSNAMLKEGSLSVYRI